MRRDHFRPPARNQSAKTERLKLFTRQHSILRNYRTNSEPNGTGVVVQERGDLHFREGSSKRRTNPLSVGSDQVCNIQHIRVVVRSLSSSAGGTQTLQNCDKIFIEKNSLRGRFPEVPKFLEDAAKLPDVFFLSLSSIIMHSLPLLSHSWLFADGRWHLR